MVSTSSTRSILAGMTAAFPTLAEAILDYRQRRGITATALGIELGITRSHMTSIEKGKTDVPQLGLRRKLAEKLGVSHVAVLVMAGELSPEEVDPALLAPPAFPLGDARNDVLRRLGDLTPSQAEMVRALCEEFARVREGSGDGAFADDLGGSR